MGELHSTGKQLVELCPPLWQPLRDLSGRPLHHGRQILRSTEARVAGEKKKEKKKSRLLLPHERGSSLCLRCIVASVDGPSRSQCELLTVAPDELQGGEERLSKAPLKRAEHHFCFFGDAGLSLPRRPSRRAQTKTRGKIRALVENGSVFAAAKFSCWNVINECLCEKVP